MSPSPGGTGSQRLPLESPEKTETHMILEDLEQKTSECTLCRLHGCRINVVFGSGKPDAEIMFVGEGPGENEDREGIPFIGMAGNLLNRVLRDAGLCRDDVYISNIVKCRPPGNRDPKPDESKTCFPILKQQIQIIQPRVIVALGRVAACA